MPGKVVAGWASGGEEKGTHGVVTLATRVSPARSTRNASLQRALADVKTSRKADPRSICPWEREVKKEKLASDALRSTRGVGDGRRLVFSCSSEDQEAILGERGACLVAHL